MSDGSIPTSWRSDPPSPAPPRDWKFPELHRRTLSNGLRVIAARHSSAPLASVRAVVHSGAGAEPTDRAGLAAMTAGLLEEGAAGRGSLEIAEDVARLGAFLGAGADWDASYVALDVLSRNLDRGLEIVRDVLLHPDFEEGEIERAREERLTSIIQQRDDPASIAARNFSGRLYEGIRYGTPLSGTESTVRSIGREDITGFYRSTYVPSNVSLVITGDIDPDQVIEAVEKLFGGWEGSSGTPPGSGTPRRAESARTVIVNRPGSVQSEIRIGHVGVARSTEDYFSIVVMNALLGEVFNSRIMLNLRERHGYTYGARSSFIFRKHAGPFVVSTAVRSEVTAEAVSEIFLELDRIRREQIGEDELEHAKNYLMGVFPATVETANNLANRVQEMELYGLPVDYFEHYRENIRKVTSSDAARAAERYISPDSATIVVVGEAKDLFDRLSELGHSTEVVDIDGRPVVGL